jgi:hypothetical protein
MSDHQVGRTRSTPPLGLKGLKIHSGDYEECFGGTCLLATAKLHGLSPRENYTDRATAACRRGDCQLLRKEGCHVISMTGPYSRILGFLDRSSRMSLPSSDGVQEHLYMPNIVTALGDKQDLQSRLPFHILYQSTRYHVTAVRTSSTTELH